MMVMIFPSTDEKAGWSTLCPFLDKNGMWRRLIFDILISLGKRFLQKISNLTTILISQSVIEHSCDGFYSYLWSCEKMRVSVYHRKFSFKNNLPKFLSKTRGRGAVNRRFENKSEVWIDKFLSWFGLNMELRGIICLILAALQFSYRQQNISLDWNGCFVIHAYTYVTQ